MAFCHDSVGFDINWGINCYHISRVCSIDRFLANGEFNLSTSPVTDIFNTMFTTSSVKSYVCFVGVFLFISTSLHLMRIWLIAQFGVSLIHDMSCTLIKNILATDYPEYSKVSNSEYAAIVLQETLEVSNKFYRPVLDDRFYFYSFDRCFYEHLFIFLKFR